MTLTTVGYGDLSAGNVSEMVYSSVIMIIGAIIYAVILGVCVCVCVCVFVCVRVFMYVCSCAFGESERERARERDACTHALAVRTMHGSD